MYKFLLILLFSNFCIAGTIDPKVSDEEYLNYGKKFIFVAKVVGEKNYASAVIISNNTFLTSAHVANKINKIIVENKEFEISEIIIHKDYDKKSHNNDIAIGKIQGDFNLDFYPELYSDKNEIGKTVSICGYGATGDFSTGKNKIDKKRRAGSNVINETTEFILFCSPTDAPNTQLELLICHGDSGGGLFLDNKLCGLNSHIEAKDGTYNSNYNDKAGHVRISRHITWIKEHLSN